MDLASTFGLFFAILSGVGLISAALNNVLGHDPRPSPAVPAGVAGDGLPSGVRRSNALRGEAIATHAEDFPQPQRCGEA